MKRFEGVRTRIVYEYAFADAETLEEAVEIMEDMGWMENKHHIEELEIKEVG